MTGLKVQLFGQFSITFDGVPITALHTSRLQELLAYLILNRETPISRYNLACLFWPESSEDQTHTNLRNLIHQLRQAFPNTDQFIQIDHHFLEWRSESAFNVDVADFERYLGSPQQNGARREALVQAVEIYRGDLLPGCYSDWIIPERERLRQAYHQALETLAMIAEDARDYPAAVSYTNRLILSDPLQSTANYRLVRLFSLLGDRPAALKAYQAYARLLQDELETEPEAEMKNLYESIRKAAGTKPKPAAENLPPFVGRKAEWRKLLSIWKTSSAGCSQIVFISGEAGIGKTRLVQELNSWASHLAIRTATAYCYSAEGNLPYAPVVSWLRAEPLPPLEKIWLSEVSRLLPEVAQKNPGLTKVEPLREAWQRQRLFEALAHALLTKRQKTLLILEDTHWCDQDTLEWLHYLLRFDPKAPLLIMATVRSGEIAQDHPLIALQTALRAEGKYTEVELGPMSEVETIALIGQTAQEVSGENLNSEFISQIVRESEGNPLFAIERVRLGQVSPNITGIENQVPGESEKVKAILTRRIHQLSQDARETTCLAAVIGREFSLDVLRTASGEDEVTLVTSIDEMLQRHVIREISADTYDFTHDRLRGAAFGGLSSAHQRLLHRKVAEAYLVLDEASPHPRNSEIASHYENAGLLLQAVHHYRLAGEYAARIFANAEAQRHFQHAIELAEDLGIGTPNGIDCCDFATLLERCGDLLALNGKYPQAQAAFEQALAQPASCAKLWYSQIYRKISNTFIYQYQHPSAFKALDQAEQMWNFQQEEKSPEEKREWIQIQLDRCQLYYWDNQAERIFTVAQKIEPIIEEVGSTVQQADLLSTLVQARARHERFRISEETVELAKQEQKIAEKTDDSYSLAWGYFLLGFTLLWAGRAADSYGWLVKAYDQSERIGARLLQLRCLAYQSTISRQQRNIALLERQTEELLKLAPAIGDVIYHGVGLANQGWIAWCNEDELTAWNDCRMAIELWNKFPGGYAFYAHAAWPLLSMAVKRRDIEEALRSTQTMLEPTSQGLPEPLSTLLNDALRAYQAKDDDSAFHLFTQAVEQAIVLGEL